MVHPGAAYQADAVTVLVGHNPPAVVLLLIDPPGPVEGFRSQFRLHGDEGGGGKGHPCNYLRWETSLLDPATGSHGTTEMVRDRGGSPMRFTGPSRPWGSLKW